MTDKPVAMSTSDTPTPFECENCGHKPTAQEVVEHRADCAKCKDTVIAYTLDAAEVIAQLERKLAAAKADSARLDWLLNYITTNGLNGMRTLAWTSYDEDGKSLMDRAAVSEDEVAEVRFDRAAIDAARNLDNPR